jgi:hypothetical protein
MLDEKSSELTCCWDRGFEESGLGWMFVGDGAILEAVCLSGCHVIIDLVYARTGLLTGRCGEEWA